VALGARELRSRPGAAPDLLDRVGER
jgi:hypothetical protein